MGESSLSCGQLAFTRRLIRIEWIAEHGSIGGPPALRVYIADTVTAQRIALLDSRRSGRY
jgi:hypothetical protein